MKSWIRVNGESQSASRRIQTSRVCRDGNQLEHQSANRNRRVPMKLSLTILDFTATRLCQRVRFKAATCTRLNIHVST